MKNPNRRNPGIKIGVSDNTSSQAIVTTFIHCENKGLSPLLACTNLHGCQWDAYKQEKPWICLP